MMISRRVAIFGASLFLIAHHASAATSYAEHVDATFEREDKASGVNGYFKCELDLAILKVPTALNLRVMLLKHLGSLFPTVTIDVGEFTMSNGIPYNLRKTPIIAAGIASNIIDTTQNAKQIDMGDGGIGIALTAEQFNALTTVIVRGDYIVTYLVKGSNEATAMAVHEGVNAKVFDQYYSCNKSML